jgi:alpha-galactosidase
VREQTLAVYRLLDELKSTRPGLEIESCASGGARVDLGILDHTDRIWTSDSLDPIERLTNQRHTALVIPPELMGMHVTSPVVHSSGRSVGLGFSAAVALFGHFGIEWDLTTVDEDTRGTIARWVTLAKRLRPLVATGHTIDVDGTDPGIDVRGMVAHDGSSAVFTITQVETTVAYPAGRIRLPGLDPARVYRLQVLAHGPEGDAAGQSALEWAESSTVLTGRQLAVTGIRPPVQLPQQSTVLELIAEH